MVTKEVINNTGQTHWKLRMPDEHCKPGLEVGIFATAMGLVIGESFIRWYEIDEAKNRARAG